MSDAMQLADRVRNACIVAALEGYQRAKIAGLCQEGAWECAIDAMRMLELKPSLQPPVSSPPRGRSGPASA